MRYTISEQLVRMKKLMEQDSWVTKAASGPQKCGITKGDEGSNSREDRQWDKEVKRQERIDAKYSAKVIKDYANPYIDTSGYKIPKDDFNAQYSKFVASNPDFETLPSKLSAEQRFGILYKESRGLLTNDQYYLRNKLNKMFNRTGPITMEQFYDMIKQMGGFDKYYELWSQGFPSK